VKSRPFLKSANLLVFLKPKIISADAVVPLMLEIKQQHPGVRIHFFVPNDSWPETSAENGRRTWMILQQNYVLWRAMESAGKIRLLHYLGNPHRPAWLNLCQRAVDFGRLALLVLLSRHTHVFYLQNGPGRFFRYLNRLVCRRGRRFSVEAVKFNSAKFVSDEEKLKGKAVVQQFDFADASLSFSHIHYARSPFRRKYLLGASHTFPAWRRHVRRQAELFYQGFFREHPECTGKKLLLYCLSIVDAQPGYGADEMRHGILGMQKLFLETMAILDEFSDRLAFLLKPHYITDTDFVQSVVRRLQAAHFFLVYAHPEIILAKAAAQLCNGFSTTFWDGRLMGVPTIEYSDYSEKMWSVLNGQPFAPEAVDYFINNDPQRLRQVLADVVDGRAGASPARNLFPAMDLSFCSIEGCC